MKTKVITLPIAINRQQIIKNRFQDKNINFEFFNGVDINDVIFDKNNCGFLFDNKFYKINKEHLLKNTNRLWIRFGEIGCLLAHYKIYKNLLNDLDNEAYLICEDDCRPCDNFYMDRLKQYNYSNIDLLYLQSVTAHYQNKQPLVNALPNCELQPSLKIINQNIPILCEGTAAFIITKNGAKKFCDHIDKNGYDGPIDNLLARLPELIRHCPSDLENYFLLENTAKYSFAHSGDFKYNYNIFGMELKSNKELKFR